MSLVLVILALAGFIFLCSPLNAECKPPGPRQYAPGQLPPIADEEAVRRWHDERQYYGN